MQHPVATQGLTSQAVQFVPAPVLALSLGLLHKGV